jgi:hypothetical protein
LQLGGTQSKASSIRLLPDIDPARRSRNRCRFVMHSEYSESPLVVNEEEEEEEEES